MTLFDRYIAVDWSASNVPKSGKDSIWIGEVVRRGRRLERLPSRNPRTRAAAMADITDTLLAARAVGHRVMLGFDFVFGYPAGAAAAIGGAPGWEALWAKLHELVEDGPDNRSNRFDVAARINLALGALGPRYWGHPHGRVIRGLTPRRPPDCYGVVPERRLAEAQVRGPQPVWKLTGVGSVGSQTLLGIARLEALRRDERFAGEIAIWPFETEFEHQLQRSITVVEIYPSLFPVTPADGLPRDRAQVEVSARRFAEADLQGTLATLLSAPQSLDVGARSAVVAEEGWIAGVGHGALLANQPAAVEVA